MSSLSVIPYKPLPTAWSMRTFHLYIAKVSPPRSTARAKIRISVTFADLGHFLTSDVILKVEFLSVSLDLAYRSNETFCSRTHRFGCWKLWLAGKARKVHRNGGYPAAHFEFCRRTVTPSGPPSALTSSRTDTSPLLDFSWFFVVAVVNVHFALLCVVVVVGCFGSFSWLFIPKYNCCIDINLWSLLFRTTFCKLTHLPVIPYITKPHPPPVFIAPRIYIISKNGVFILHWKGNI